MYDFIFIKIFNDNQTSKQHDYGVNKEVETGTADNSEIWSVENSDNQVKKVRALINEKSALINEKS